MIDLAILLGSAALAYSLAFKAKLPTVPILMLVGWVLSISPFAPDRDFSSGVLELGLAFLLFSAGIELSPRRFSHQTVAAVWVALVQFLLIGLVGMTVARWLGYGELASIYIGFALSASSTLVVIRHLRQQQQMFQPFGRLVTGVLLIQDAAVILMLTLLTTSSRVPGELFLSLGALVLLGSFAVFCHVLLVPKLLARLSDDDETLLMTGLAILFLFIGMAHAMGLPPLAGAFLAGFTLSSFPVNGLMRGLVGSLSEFFHALFFVALGAMLVVTGWGMLFEVLVLSLMVVLLTPPVVAFIAEWRGQNARNAIESGLLLAQSSELGIVLVLVGTRLGHLQESTFSLVALVAALTMTLTSLLATDAFTWRLLHWHPSRRGSVTKMDRSGHILILGFGSAGMWAAKPFLDAGFNIVVVDDDPAVIEVMTRKKITCLRADGSDPRVLEQVNARQARLIIASLPRLSDLLKIIHWVGTVRVIARVFEEHEVKAVEEAGGTAVHNAEAAASAFEDWFQQSEASS
ncbi:MAG: cation:proton antiporter [Candidatus Methylacidiphilales bacterium]